MNRNGVIAALVVLVAGMAWYMSSSTDVTGVAIPDSPEAVERGRYLAHAGGCITCHQREAEDDDSLSGGHALESPFGTFYASNITPDPETGIGGWSGADFIGALKHGRSPDGGRYFPAFPYRAYEGISDQEALDIAAWLMSLEPVRHEVSDHELPPWLARWQMAFWNPLADLLEGEVPAVTGDEQVERGAYLARNLGHCGDCHTPRNALGIPDLSREFAGAELSEDDSIPPIDTAALADWSEDDFALLLFLGMLPDGDYVGGEMGDVVEHNTARLTEADREAMAAFFIRGQQ